MIFVAVGGRIQPKINVHIRLHVSLAFAFYRVEQNRLILIPKPVKLKTASSFNDKCGQLVFDMFFEVLRDVKPKMCSRGMSCSNNHVMQHQLSSTIVSFVQIS